MGLKLTMKTLQLRGSNMGFSNSLLEADWSRHAQAACCPPPHTHTHMKESSSIYCCALHLPVADFIIAHPPFSSPLLQKLSFHAWGTQPSHSKLEFGVEDFCHQEVHVPKQVFEPPLERHLGLVLVLQQVAQLIKKIHRRKIKSRWKSEIFKNVHDFRT